MKVMNNKLKFLKEGGGSKCDKKNCVLGAVFIPSVARLFWQIRHVYLVTIAVEADPTLV